MAVIAMEATRVAGTMQGVKGSDSNEGLLKRLTARQKNTVLLALSQVRCVVDAEPKVAEAVALLLGHQDPEVVAAAAPAVSSLGRAAGKYLDHLVAATKHPTAGCRAAALEAVGSLGPPLRKETSRAIASCLEDQEAGVRVVALQALAQMRATEQAEAVWKLLSDPATDVHAAALETLGAFLSASHEIESLFPKEALAEQLVASLGNPQTSFSALSCVAVLGQKAPLECIPSVIALLSENDIVIREAAVTAVGSLAKGITESIESMDMLKGLLKSEVVGTRAAAAYALAALGTSSISFADSLLELLADNAVDDPSLALRMGSGARRPPSQLRMPKSAALTALGKLGSASYASKIADFLFDQNWEVRVAAGEALASLGTQAKNEVSTLQGLLDDDAYPVRLVGCFALGAVKDPEALPRLVEAFEDPAHSVRSAALAAVAEMGEVAEDVSHDVFKLLNDHFPSVRAAAARCLSMLGDASQHYASAIGPLLHDESPEVRCAVLAALPRMGASGASFSDEVTERLDDAVKEVRQAAVQALEKMGARPPALPMLKDFGRGPGAPVDQGSFEGLGSHYGGIQQKKLELQLSGKWIDGVL